MLIKGALLIGLLLAAACGGGTAATSTPSPSHSLCSMCVPATGQLTFTGDVAGTMTANSKSDCARRPPPDQDVFELVFYGTGLTTDVEADKGLSGKEWVLVVDGSVSSPDAVDAGLGPTSFHVSIYLSHVGQGTTHSSVTVAHDMRSGSLNLQLKGEVLPRETAQTRVTGTFSCAFA